ncbi:MAG: hypothetical protein CVU19_10750 [Betaproteobacteria bacterium HGW-Betaproteobacteria-13]|uniref:Uncharacterized protein n=1 Tax=Parazoarcus communis TaxID=41977 RepID=A0A2U8H335_9RHOO|nr:hypothetical protein CEW87_14200 [Parazoarcus communis]PKO80729.1 MAG: hypothetical protein CVU19_10750 [Betaproteobacteria bacterium HGW-Betaproteobacteria-13]
MTPDFLSLPAIAGIRAGLVPAWKPAYVAGCGRSQPKGMLLMGFISNPAAEMAVRVEKELGLSIFQARVEKGEMLGLVEM